MARVFDIEKLRNKFDSETKKKKEFVSNFYPFYKMDVDKTARIRFLPDADINNEWDFFIENKYHDLIINGHKKRVPCLSMYSNNKDCPICKLSAEYYKNGDKATGLKYWRRLDHIFQCLVIEDPLPPNENGETYQNKVKQISLTTTLFKIIEEAIRDREIKYPIFDYKKGTDFLIKLSRQGENNSYILSKFSRESTELSDEMIENVEKEMINLSSLIPKNPGVEKLQELLEAHLNGTPVASETKEETKNEEQFEEEQTSKVKESKVETKVESKVETKAESKVEETTKPTTKKSSTGIDAEAILNRIKNRG